MSVSYLSFMMWGGLWLSMAVEQPKRCQNEDSTPCAAGEFFDNNVGCCSSCADICQLKPDKSTDASCQYFCPGYHMRTNFSRHSLAPKESGLGSTSLELLPAHEDSALVKKPLFWTSVVSVFISVVATIILVVLCTCKKSRSTPVLRRMRHPPQPQTKVTAQRVNGKSESSTGMLKNAEDANDPLLTLEKNFSKDKCGKTFALPIDHAFTLDSCAIDHETIVSLCQSSYLHKPCVASFEDFGYTFSNENMHLFSMYDYDRKDKSGTSTGIYTSVNISTNANAVTSTDMSMQRMDSGRPENLEGGSPLKGSEKPFEAIEICTFDSGYFVSSSCKSVTKADSSVTYDVYTVPLSSRKATDTETKRYISFHAQETHACKDERSSVANLQCYTEIPTCAFYGSESKATGNRWPRDSGTKPSVLPLLGRIKDVTCDKSALRESSEETSLKQMQPAGYCILNNVPEYGCSTSLLEPSYDICVPAKDLPVHEFEKQDDGKQLPKLNLKMRSGADIRKSVPDVLKVDVRNFSKCAEDDNDEDTMLKTWKRSTYPKSTKTEKLTDINGLLCMEI